MSPEMILLGHVCPTRNRTKKLPAGKVQQHPAGKNQMVKVPRTLNIASMGEKSTKIMPQSPGASEEAPG